MSLEGRRIVLTGVSRGIGLVCAQELLRAGAAVLGIARDAERLEAASKKLRHLGEFSCLAVDVGREDAGAAIAGAAEKRWGSVDVLVNNAAIMDWRQDFEAERPDLLEKTFRVNLFGPHRLTLALLPLLRKGTDPRIVNVSSGAGTLASLRDPAGASYKLSKYSLNALTLLYSGMLKGVIAVNSMDPGWVKTDMGGPNAPGDPGEVGHLLIKLLEKPSTETGKFWYGEWELGF